MNMLMLDMCAGLGGASRPMRDRGWTVVTLDNDPRFSCDITADLCAWSWTGETPDLLWISPPCTDFARDHLPWIVTSGPPDMTIAHAARRLIDQVRPRWWAVENVIGAVPFFTPLFGRPRHMQRPYVLWGSFPPIGRPRIVCRHKESYSSKQRAERAIIPYALSYALAVAIESQGVLI